jgi:hypothetical protein
MTLTTHVIHNSTLAVRIATTIFTVAAVAALVAAGIAIGVIVGRQTDKSSPFIQTTTVLQSDITVSLDRLIVSYELQQFYDAPATLRDLIQSLNAKIKLYYPQTAIQFVISAFSGEPILVSTLDEKRKRQLTNRPSIVAVSGSAYFTQNYTSDEVRAAFLNYTRTIILVDVNSRKPSPGLGTFSSTYSTFTGTYPSNLTISEANSLISISLNNNNGSSGR